MLGGYAQAANRNGECSVVRKAGASAGIRTSAVAALAAIGWIGVVGCSDESPGSGAASTPAEAPASASTPGSDATSGSGSSAAGGSVPASGDPAGGESGGVPAVADSRTPEERIEAGRGVYNANCIACHAMDPRRDGALGPAVAGASSELLEARVLRGEYPAGYAPKRETKVMIPLPHLEAKLPELAAYLQSLD